MNQLNKGEKEMSEKNLKRYVADIGIAAVASSATWVHHGNGILGIAMALTGVGAVMYGNLIGTEDSQ
jgi:hypothetical protein